MKMKVCVVGYGNVGKEAVKCVQEAPDMEVCCILKKNSTDEIVNFPAYTEIDDVKGVDVAILCIPSREVPSMAPKFLEKGINTVDCFDIHGEKMLALKKDLSKRAVKAGKVSVTAAGWDPGIDSIMRILVEAMAPYGVTYTNFGPGMSMGHTVIAKSVVGVKDAVSLTLPLGYGEHKREVYVEPEEGACFSAIEASIKEDPYFSGDRTKVFRVENVSRFQSKGHGVSLQRFGTSGSSENQLMEWKMRISNPSLTAQIMTSVARACRRLSPGAYTLPEVPPIYLLPGDTDNHIKELI